MNTLKNNLTYIDSHCHLDRLDLTAYQGELSLALAAAQQNGVSHFLCVAIDLDTFPSVLNLAETFPNVFASIGVHPTEVILKEPTVEALCQLAQHSRVVALGETGLDYYHQDTEKKLQQERFRTHIRAARAVKKPLIVHTRQARLDTLTILKEEGAETVGGVLHCFTEDWDMAQKAMELNFYISFSGIVTFQNAKELKAIAQQVPLNRMLIETDAPYLAPVPYRGKPNEPAYVRHVAECIAELRGVPAEEIARNTTQNFLRLFQIVL
jgi:TatD DNase family protein